jgi:cytochrome c-type biogenesis protein CcmH
MRQLLVLLSLLIVVSPTLAIDTEKAFDDPELQARYDEIISEVRCLKCQNNTLKDSSAFLASDLRREIRLMIEEGLSNDEIYDFLVDRYGEFALYRPRTRGKTLILWIAPGILLLGGIAVVGGVIRKRMSLPVDEDGS